MSEHIGERALELALGALPADEAEALRAHVDGCASCQAELAEAEAEVAGWAMAAEPMTPSPAARARLIAALEDPSPFAPLVSALAQLADMGESAMRALVGTLDEATAWLVGPADAVHVVHVPGGPATEGCILGFVRVQKGEVFPHHSHLGDELALVMQGTLIDEADGRRYGPGDTLAKAAGSAHTVRAGDDEDLIYLVSVRDGIALDDDDVIGPDDPRI